MNPQKKYLSKFPQVMAYVPRDANDELISHCKRNRMPKSQYVSRLIVEDLERVTGQKFNYETHKFEEKRGGKR
jgi:hypothetical protein